MSGEGPQQSLSLSITVSSGAGTGTITSQWTVARWIRVKPVNETDSYTLTLKDADGIIMGLYSGQVGTFSSKLEMSLGILKTIAISGASVDGTYTCKFDMH